MSTSSFVDVQKRIGKEHAASKALRRMMHMRAGLAWRAWRGRVAAAKAKRVGQYRAIVAWRKAAARKAFSIWAEYVVWRREKKQIMQRCAYCSVSTACMLTSNTAA